MRSRPDAALPPRTGNAQPPRLRGLWLSRDLPFPLDSGARVYTAQLVRALAEAGADLTLTGFAPEGARAPSDWPVRFERVNGNPRSKLRSLLSLLPLVAAGFSTPAYRALVDKLAREPWDFVVIDLYGMAWAIDAFDRARTGRSTPVLVHVSHNHETSLAHALWQGFKGSALKRAVLWQNQLKTRAAERRIVQRVDLLTAITTEDAARFALEAPNTPSVVLTPGYTGPVAEHAAPRATLPRTVLLVGSFHWLVKQHNLRQFIAAADPVFARHGITLDVVGSMPDALAQSLRASTRATRLHGFVEDIAPMLAASRLAVVPESIGGGFKLKFLDYVFGRVPVATLTGAAAGLSEPLRASMLCCDDFHGLVQGIVDIIDQPERLDRMQQQAFDAAKTQFRWADRGEAMLAAVRDRSARAPALRPAIHRPASATPGAQR